MHGLLVTLRELIDLLKHIKLLVLPACLLMWGACTSQPLENLPGEQVMHFPFSMALKGDTLVVSASDSDGRYSYGRMVALDTRAVDQALKSGVNKSPVPWKSIVSSNMMIPQDVGPLSMGDSLYLASRQNNQLYKVPLLSTGLACNDAWQKIDTCKDISSVKLYDFDPFALEIIGRTGGEETVLLSYLTSSRLDLLKSQSGAGIILSKRFDTLDFLNAKAGFKLANDSGLITKKIQLIKDDVYFLLEQSLKNNPTPASSKEAYLIAIKASDFLTSDLIADAAVRWWNLDERLGIAGAQDFYVDPDTNEALILGRSPEALYKINLATDSLIETTPACFSTTMMAVWPKQNRIFLPCFNSNRVASFSIKPLELKTNSGILGRGPAYIVIDENKSSIYVSYQLSGKVVIFDVNLNFLGHIFDSAPHNRIGS